ncbi:MAG: prenyltransferase/squalene oxidase repeat-containing protein [Planctomycetota bacterium]|jgi:hypothetical protein
MAWLKLLLPLFVPWLLLSCPKGAPPSPAGAEVDASEADTDILPPEDPDAIDAINAKGFVSPIRFPEPDYEKLDPIFNTGLAWLARNQHPAGCWGTRQSPEKSISELPLDGHGMETTGLGLLAFLGVGHSHRRGKHKGTVKKALKFLAGKQGKDGSFPGIAGDRNEGRAHAICAMALAEAYGLSNRSPLLHDRAQNAVNHLVRRQQAGSGWARGDGSLADTVTTGWALMALKSARVATLEIPGNPFEGARKLLENVGDRKSGRARLFHGSAEEEPSDFTTMASTAASLLSRIICFPGKAGTTAEFDGAMSAMLDNLPVWEDSRGVDLEHLYFGTYAAYFLNGEFWNRWNPARKRALFSSQVLEGEDRGSWPPHGPLAHIYGRDWATAMSLLILEPYFRHGPVTKTK